MSHLVIDLQKNALDNSVNISDLLKKAFVVAKKLKIKEFEKWINDEMNGYIDIDNVPKYRYVFGKLKAFDPYRGWIPSYIKDNEFERKVRSKKMTSSINKLEYLINDDESNIVMTFNGEVNSIFVEMFEFETEYALFIDKGQVKNILEAVRMIILNWALELEADGVLGEKMIFTKEEKEIATYKNYTVNNFYGNFEKSQIQQNTDNSNITIDKEGD